MSIDSNLRETRAIAGMALLELVACVVSGALTPGYPEITAAEPEPATVK